MATREKKLSVGRKQNTSSPSPPKEEVIPAEMKTDTDDEISEENQATKNATTKMTPPKTTPLAKKLNKSGPKKLTKKPTIAIKLKTTIKKNVKMKQKMIKAVLNNPKNAETKKKLLKTCVKQVRPKKARVVKSDKAEENLPPVLEPILPIDEELGGKPKKKGTRPPKIDNYSKKACISDNETLTIDPAKAKRVYRKKPKPENQSNETIEDVMNDLSSLIKSGEMKELDVASESGKSDSLKPKKVIRRRKKENIETTLSKLSPSQRKVIDMLDLNVAKFKGLPSTRRRHSIEKFPIESVDIETQSLGRLSILSNLPRSVSPRTKPLPKFRQALDGFGRRASPYKTRSDSPARILRNGKQRKLKDLELLGGLDTTLKRRKRNCSEFSGSEMSLPKSGYESDSSFSDLSSVHGAENTECKDPDIVKTERKDNFETNENLADNVQNSQIKRSLSTEAEDGLNVRNITDTNSNLYVHNKENNLTNVAVKIEDDMLDALTVSPSVKVPEKSIILDIMKQTFNDTFDEKGDKERKFMKTKSGKQKTEPIGSEFFYGRREEFKEEKFEEPHKNDNEISSSADFEIGSAKTTETTDDREKMDVDKQKMLDESVRSPKNLQENVLNGNMNEMEQDGNSHKGEKLIEETPEDLAIKENILQALGLQSLKAAKEAKLKNKEKSELKNDCYTGTLKTVIKINRGEKKKGRMKMPLQKAKNKNEDQEPNGGVDESSKSTKDGPSTSWKHSGQSSDTAGAHRKSHYSNRSNMDGSSEHTSDGETAVQEGSTKALVIPEKASSFSIHPGRICKDECSYCFGKFGLFDTPCHIAQMKSVERQNKILAAEKHLTRDSCLCDACYRHIDRKANTPSYTNKSYKRNAAVAPGPRQDHCHVLGCHKVATNILRRKWIIKMRKSICEVINIDLDNPGLHSIPICDEHYSALEYLMVCAMCKRRLAKNHVHYLGPEVADLNPTLSAEGIPLTLTDKPVVCKLCKYFAAIILKSPEDRPEMSSTFFTEYKKRLLHFNDIVPMDEAAAEEPIIIPTKDNKFEKEQIKKKRKTPKQQSVSGDGGSDSQVEIEKSDQSRVPSTDSNNQSRPESPSDYMVDYNTLIPSIAMECGSDSESKKEAATKPAPSIKKLPLPETVKQAVEISKNMKLKNDRSSDIAVQRLGSNPSISVRQLFPCEEDLPLQGQIDFGNVKERTPEGWEKCTSVIQYDMDTKHLWQELQKPYGNQSSFLRHLILLEKYFRNGDLILSPNASHHSINYSESVHNRLRAYDNIPSSAGNVQPISMLPFNKAQKSISGIITSTTSSPVIKENSLAVPPVINAANVPKSTPITISQLNSPPLIPPPPAVANVAKPKPAGAPPGLISLHPGTNRPVAPVNKPPQSQKIKFPITKNWRPNLIPIDPSKKNTERKAGLVQVISGGKPYHITLEDYKKMCAIKKSFELKQKRLQEASNAGKAVKVSSYQSVLKSMAPRKGLVISKTAATSPKNDAGESSESILEKLDKQVEKLEARHSENKPPLSLPKIPKSLTVIPQTVTRKPSRPSSPVLLITAKPKQITNKS